MLRHLRAIGLTVALIGLGSASVAFAERSGTQDPDWPCQQIKVPDLSLAAVWSGPPIDTGSSAWRRHKAVADLVARLTPRRMPIETATSEIGQFARQAGDHKSSDLLLLMAGLFSALGEERDGVMAGLDRFGNRQKELAARIRDENARLRAMQSDAAADSRAVQDLVKQVTWDAQLLQDRRQALSQVCDVPSRIEKRLFALARAIQEELH